MRDAATTARYGPDPAELFALAESEAAVFLPVTTEYLPLTVNAPLVSEFRALDSTGAFDGGPYPAHLLRHVRDNIEATARERWWSNGVALNRTTGSYAGLSSPWPVPWGPFWVYTPGRAKSLMCRLSCGDVLSYQSASTLQGRDAVRLCLTSIAPDGRAVAPPSDPVQWVTLHVGESPTVVDVPLYGRQLSGLGWCGALLWTWSVIDSTILDSGAVTGVYSRFTVELDADEIADTVPHLAIRLMNDWGADLDLMGTGGIGQGGGGIGGGLGNAVDGPMYGIGHHRNELTAIGVTAGPAEATIVPPLTDVNFLAGLAYGYSGWTLHGMGYVEVLGITLLAEPAGPLVPERDVYASKTPASAAADSNLVGAAAQLGRTRVPTWGGHPVSVRAETTPWLGCWIGDYGDALRMSDTTARALCSTIIPAAISDTRGYTAIVSFQTVINEDTRETANLLMRLVAYTINGAEQDATDWTPVEQYWSHTPEEAGWSGVMIQIEAGRRSGGGGGMYWRWLGSLMGWPDDWMREVPRTGHQVLNWFGPSLTYPVELRVECKLDRTDVHCFVYVAGAAIASLYRDIPL